MTDAEKVREALHEPYKIRGDGKVSRKANEDAIAALGSILTELAEAKEQQFTIQELRARSDAVAAAEERAEKAEARARALDASETGWRKEAMAYGDSCVQLEARIQELEAENDRLRQGLVEALEEQP